MACADWETRLHHVSEMLMGLHAFSSREDLEAAITSFYQKLVCADAYVPQAQVTSDITLVRSSEMRSLAKNLGEDYGLGKVSPYTDVLWK